MLRLRIFFIAFATVFPSHLFAAPQIGVGIGRAMQDRDYTNAIRQIDEAMKSEEAPRDYLLYLKGRAYHYQDRYDEAMKVYDQFAQDFPKSAWARRVRFAKALAHARKNEFRDAEIMFRQEAEFVLSMDRKDEIAEIYLQFARRYFKPDEKTEKPDYQKAVTFFQKALEVAPDSKGRPDTELLVGQCYQNLNNWDEAIKRFSQFVEKNSDAKLDIEARYRLGQCHFSKSQFVEARRTWQDLLAKHSESESERIAAASYELALTYRLPNPPSRVDLDLGIAVLREFIKNYPDHQLAGSAHLQIARSFQHFGQVENAAATLNKFLVDPRYQNREEIAEGRFLLGQFYQVQKRFDKALQTWKDYLTKHPAHNRWSEAQKQVINTEYLMAAEQQAAKNHDAARNLWTAFLGKNPLDSRAPQILLMFGQMKYEQEKWNEAFEDWRRLVSKHPGTEPASRAQMAIAQTLEEKLGKFEEALKEYKKVTWGSQQNPAKQRAARLIAKQMTIRTERVFLTDEQPSIKLTSRNLEKVSVRTYNIDLETYFRKMHLATGVESLDIALIDPDATFDFEIPDYQKYKQTELDIPLKVDPSETGGVLVVTVSSESLEATTMVVQSDLDIIVKSSRDEVFVYAQNMRTGKPWPGANLLLSDGNKHFDEAKTGEEGVFQKSYDELKSANDVRVFAMNGRHTASNVIGLRGLGVAQGLSNKGFIYTDRPVYRPGQNVNVRGIVRRVADDTYKIDEGKLFKLSVFDTRNRNIWQQEVKLSQFGSFRCNFVVPPDSPQGSYRIQINDNDRQQYQGSFAVQQFKLDNIQLRVESERTVFYRGEKITGTISARYYYGGPLAGREVKYRLGNDRQYSAKTDKDGKVAFELETRDLRESQALNLVVELPEQSLAIAKPFVIAAQGFSLSLNTVRSTYLSGESFEVNINAIDAEGKPISRDLQLSVLERTVIDGRTGERQVEQKKIKTDEKDGAARATFALQKGATYILRAEGTDRFSNPVTGQHVVNISGDDDKVRLRILANEHTFRVGDKPSVRVHWREEPTLGLITFQGARVLGYRLVELKKGMNEIEVPMTAQLAPNFEFAVGVMVPPGKIVNRDNFTPRRFHSASSPFVVQRDLNVTVETPKTEFVKPGDDVEIKVKTTNQQGNPISAEVSLAMVEQALLDRFSSQHVGITNFFRDARRKTAVRTTSSVSFHYRPKTKAINTRLLAEAERLVMDAEEENRLAESTESLDDLFENNLPTLSRSDRDGVPTAGRYRLGIGVNSDAGLTARNGRGAGEVADSLERLSAENESQQTLGFRQNGANREYFQQLKGESQLGRTLNRAGQNAHWSLVIDDDGDGAELDRRLVLGFGVDAKSWHKNPSVLTAGITAHFKNGVVQQYSNATLAVGGDGLIQKLHEAGAVLRPSDFSEETGYWNPSIITDDHGEAIVKFAMPERSTAWKLIAKGITRDTLAGEAQSPLIAKKKLFGELKLPMALTDGDAATILATVHNEAIKDGSIDVTLKTTIGEKVMEQSKKIDVAEKQLHELSFDVQLERPNGSADAAHVIAKFELIVKSGDHTDLFERTVPLLPYGMPVFDVASGVASGDTTAWIELPENMPVSSPSMEIVIGPSVERGLLDILLAPALRCQLANQRVAPLSDSITSDLMAAVALQRLFDKSRDADNPQTSAIDARIRSALGQLISSQRDDGGWSWSGQGESNRYSSARTAWALAMAEKAGYEIAAEVKTKALNFLRTQIAKTPNTDYETKSILLHAISVADRGDFPLANRLYRNRQALSTSALLHLALALAEMDRLPMGEDLLQVVRTRELNGGQVDPNRAGRLIPWSSSSAEVRALYALALQSISPNSPELKKQIDWLNGHRFGHRWAPDKATGPATLALCNWSAKSKYEFERYALEVLVNGKSVTKLTFDKDARTESVRIPADVLQKGRQRVNFRATGRGRYSYQCVMEGFVAADRLKSTTEKWHVRRFHEAAQLERDGRPVKRGFDFVRGSFKSFRNALNELPVGRRGHVTLNAWRTGVSSSVTQEELEYLVITESLPSGVTVVEDSVSGGFERFEISPGQITFFVGNRRGIQTIQYDVHGYLPGQYKAAPTVIRDAYRLDRIAVAEPKEFKVLPAGEKSSDEYRMSPRELYELGIWHFQRDEMQESIKFLTELVDNWNLDPKVYQDSTRMLLDAHLQTGPAQQVVKHFEVIKERWPEMEITYDKILKIGAAYHDIGEFERGYLIFRATVESSFLTESQVAGFLQSQGELMRSVEIMTNLIREYPPESYVAAATFDLAQQVYAMAPQARTDVKLRERKITRVDLIRQGADMLNSFLTAFPNDPAADKAAFSFATAILELEQYQTTIDACERFVSRYPDSEDLDSFWYTIGYCHFALGNHAQALDICSKVAEMKRKDSKTGRTVEAANRYRSIYILGQIYHSLGKAAKAIEQYTRVKERFPDALEAIEYFSRRAIRLPEVTTVEPGKPVKVELDFRNVAKCEARVYRIDLMKFSLLRRNLSGITNINLAGVNPLHEVTMELGDGKDYRDRKHEITLPLKDEGAYLVVCRGDDLHASGLVLVTPLKVEVQEEATSGRVRTTVKHATQDSYLSDVHIKVIGSANDDFVFGETDLRGLFVADGIQGTTTVIARAAGGRYAFYRGTSHLGNPPGQAPAPQAANAQTEAPPQSQASGKRALLEGIQGRNSAIMLDNSIRQKEQYFNDKSGVKVEAVK